MSAPPLRRLAFTWTSEEARVAASRSALRAALSGGLTARHLAPLATFFLALIFTAILALTGLVARRHGEIALLLETLAFMAHRMATRRRLMSARRHSAAAIEAMRSAGAMVAEIDEDGVSLGGEATAARWNFADSLEVEDAGGMIYLWPRVGPPAFLPTRIFGADEDAEAFISFARARTAKRAMAAVSPPRPLHPTP